MNKGMDDEVIPAINSRTWDVESSSTVVVSHGAVGVRVEFAVGRSALLYLII